MPPLDAAYALTLGRGRALVLRAMVGLTGANPESRTTWVDVAPTGTWRGHPDGDFDLTPELFASAIEQFRKEATPPGCDYDHASIAPSGEGTPASGWIQDLAVKDGRLCALIEFTDKAAQMIRAGEYRFCSGVFVFDRPDKESGEPVACRLHSIALTNAPFIDGQKPIVLSANHVARVALSNGAGMKIKRDALMALLDQIEGDEIESEQLHAAVEAAAATAVAIDGAPEEESVDVDLSEVNALADKAKVEEKPKDEKGEKKADEKKLSDDVAPLAEAPALEAAPASDAGAMLISKLVEATGLDEPGVLAALETNLDAVVAALMASAGPGDPMAMSVKVLGGALAAANARLAKYDAAEKQQAERALSAEIEALVTSGRILPSQRDDWRALAVSSRAQFRKLTASLPQVVPVGVEGSSIARPGPASASLTESVVDLSDPRVIALTDAFDRMGLAKDSPVRARRIREALELSNRSAG